MDYFKAKYFQRLQEDRDLHEDPFNKDILRSQIDQTNEKIHHFQSKLHKHKQALPSDFYMSPMKQLVETMCQTDFFLPKTSSTQIHNEQDIDVMEQTDVEAAHWKTISSQKNLQKQIDAIYVMLKMRYGELPSHCFEYEEDQVKDYEQNSNKFTYNQTLFNRFSKDPLLEDEYLYIQAKPFTKQYIAYTESNINSVRTTHDQQETEKIKQVNHQQNNHHSHALTKFKYCDERFQENTKKKGLIKKIAARIHVSPGIINKVKYSRQFDKKANIVERYQKQGKQVKQIVSKVVTKTNK